MALPTYLFFCSSSLGSAGLRVTTCPVLPETEGISPDTLNWESPRQTGTTGHPSWSQGLGKKSWLCPTELESSDKHFLDCIERRRLRW